MIETPAKTHDESAATCRLRRRPRVAAAGALCVLLLATAIGNGSLHRPMPAASGRALQGEPAAMQPAARTTMRIGAFNIHGGRNAAGDFDLGRTVVCLKSLDVAGLSEVQGAFPGREDQAAQLGRELRLPWLFAPTTYRWYREDFGNGLLCALPVRQWRREPLPCTRGKGYRNAVLLEMEFRSRAVSVLVTHLDRVQDRRQQFEVVWERFLALPAPAVLMGDMNTPADDPLMVAALRTPHVHDVVAEGLLSQSAAAAIPRRIDWIFARGLRGLAAGIVDNGASDHPLVWAEVELTAGE